MLIFENNSWMGLVGNAVLILCLYILKWKLIRSIPNKTQTCVVFSCAVAICSVLTWVLSADWHNRHVDHIAIHIGDPVAFLTIPIISFILDLNQRQMNGLNPRWIVELILLVPIWFYAWIFFELVVLNWFWI